MTTIRTQAFAKVNLCLLLGGTRPDGRHELVTLIESVDLADALVVTPSGGDQDEVICDGVTGPNLVAEAIAALRAAGWGAPPIRVEIEKRIPVAAGMGGGSADAAALLRTAPALGPVAPDLIGEVAAGLGSDVPSQLDPGPSLGTGAGDVVRAVAELDTHALVVVPQPFELSTADVYGEADRLAIGRGDAELAACETRARDLPRGRRLDPPARAGRQRPSAGVAVASSRDRRGAGGGLRGRRDP